MAYSHLPILRAPIKDQQRGARFLLLSVTEPPPLLSPEQEAHAFAVKMLNYVQIATTPTADSVGTCLVFHFDNQRYIFGNAAEGTQRAMVQRKIGLNKVENIFTTGLVNWHNHGGLMGLVLTIADMVGSTRENLEANNLERKMSGRKAILEAGGVSKLNIHGGRNLSHLLATSRRFIFRKGLPLRPHEIRHDPRAADPLTAEPDWKDANINVWYMPINSSQQSSASPRKRRHDEFIEAATDGEESRKLVDTVVTQMFDSDWSMDALIETTLHQAKLPAKLFVRDAKGHIQAYTGPMPGGDQVVPDIPVLVRRPWPGATVPLLPRTSPSHQSMCYIVKGHQRRGKFNPQAAESLGVPRVEYKLLTRGENVTGKDGIVVTPDMVLGKPVEGTGFAIVDLPDTSYVETLVSRPEWSNGQIINGIKVIFWILGRDVVSDTRLQAFMQKMSSVGHIVSSPDSCPNMITLESAAAQAYKLRCIDPDRFPLPIYSNKLSLSNIPTPPTSSYEVGRTGKTIQFAPQFMHQDDKTVPFPDITKLAHVDLSKEILEMAAEAKAKASDPDFLAKIESVESDIPSRDAEVITLGTGSASPSKYRNVSATFVCVPGHGNYLFDCGENTIGQMRRVFGSELPSLLRDLKAVWVSHLHADHHLGTAAVIKAWHEETSKSYPSKKLLVASHTHMIDWLREYADVEDYGYSRLVTVIFDPALVKARIAEPRVFTSEETRAFGLKKIDACLVNHCFGALATAFTFPNGLKIAYSGDCRPSDSFVQIGQGATLLIHESTFDDELLGDAIAKKHSTMSEAIKIGKRMGARRILLTHFSQRYQKIPLFEESFEVRPDAHDQEKAELDRVVLVAFDYMRVRLGDFRKAQAFLPTLQKLLADDVDETPDLE
ncbi:beta-lactamase-like protein [Biscogniauxia marginata]|nr:beta-lactamase-like protein [Biscogniauxia marginata]